MDHLGVWFVASVCMTHWHTSIKQIAPSIVTCNPKVSCFGFVFDISGFYVCAFTDGNSLMTCCSGFFVLFNELLFSSQQFLRFLCYERLL